jgi:hypothetical protein
VEINKRKRGRPRGYIVPAQSRERVSKTLTGRLQAPEHSRSIAIARLLQETGERPSVNAVNVFLRGRTIRRAEYDWLTRNQLNWLLYWEYPP